MAAPDLGRHPCTGTPPEWGASPQSSAEMQRNIPLTATKVFTSKTAQLMIWVGVGAGLRLEALGTTSPPSTLSYLDNGVVCVISNCESPVSLALSVCLAWHELVTKA